MSSKIGEIAIEGGHGLHDGEARRRSRCLVPGVIGVCLVMVLASSLALVLVPGARAAPGPPYATVKVPCGASIQTAVNAAHPGDTILLGPCTYILKQMLTIDKSVAITGTGAGKTIITSLQNLKPDAYGNPWTIELGNAATVTLSGFTLLVTLQCIIYPGPAPYYANFFPIPLSGYAGGGIGVGGSAFLNLQSAVITTTGAAEGASCGGPSPTTAGLFSYGTGVGFGLDYLAGSPPAQALVGFGTVSGVSISGFGFDGAGILVGGGYDSPAGSYAYISHDQVSTSADDTNGCTGSHSGVSGPAIGLGDGVNASSATIVDNFVSGASSCGNGGIAVSYGSSAYIAHNSIRAGTYGVGVVVGQSGSATITYNSITGGTAYEENAGIYVEIGSSATISYNSIGNLECEFNATYVAFGACGPDPAYQLQSAGIINDNYLGLGTVVETNNLIFNTDAGIVGSGGCSSCVVNDNLILNSVDYGILGVDGSFSFGPNLIVGGTYGVGAVGYYSDTIVTLSHVVMVGQSVPPPPYYTKDACLELWGYTCTETIVGS